MNFNKDRCHVTKEGERGIRICFRDAAMNVNSEGLYALDLEGICFRERTFGIEMRRFQSGRGERIRDREGDRGLHDPCRDDTR